MSIDKVIVNTPSTTERLNDLNDRWAKIGAALTYFQQGAQCTRTLIVAGVVSPNARVLMHVNAAISELDAEHTLLHRAIVRTQEQRAAEEAVKKPVRKKGAKRVRK